MLRTPRTRRVGVALALAFAGLSSVACNDQVPLGSFGHGGAGGHGGEGAGDAGAAGAGAGALVCNAPGSPGPVNAAGSTNGVTLTYTDWTWPSAVDSMEFEIMVETQARSDGYFWAHEFDFVGGSGGFLGIQQRGGYQAEPPNGQVDIANMVVFWISGGQLAAELGDIAFPEARTHLRDDQWWTINARYDFRPCRSYWLRVGRQGTDPSGNLWYGAWIRDGESGASTFIGRILVRAALGQLAPLSSMFSNRVIPAVATSCSTPEPASVQFGVPFGGDGSVRPSRHENRFEMRMCPTSRFTELASSVRHEVGLMP